MAEIRHLASWCKNAKTQFSQKLRNLELWCLLTTYRKLCKLNWAFQRTHYWIPTIQDGWDPPSWKSAKGGPIWIKFRRLVQITEWCHSVPVILQRLRITLLLHMALYKFFYIVLYWLRWCVEMETICRIPIWRTFGRIQRHVIPRPRVTLQGAATWWIHCHDSRATCHTAGCSHLTKSMLWSCHIAGCKNSIRHIENRFSPYFILFLFLMQFRFWRAAAFVSSPIHLFYLLYYVAI